MEDASSPYVFREDAPPAADPDPQGRETAIVDGRSMSYRVYRRAEG